MSQSMPSIFAPASWPAGGEAPNNADGQANDGGSCSPPVVPSAVARHLMRAVACDTCGWRYWVIDEEEVPGHEHPVSLVYSDWTSNGFIGYRIGSGSV